MRKNIAIVFLLLFVAQIYGAVLLYARPAWALTGVPVDTSETTKNIPLETVEKERKLEKQKEKEEEKQKEKITVDWATRIVLNFAARLSSFIGTTLAEAGKGGGPLFDTRTLERGLREAGDAALGDTIDALGAGLGINLCLPPDLRLGLSLQLGKILEPPKPKCTFQEFKKKWGEFGESFSDEDIFSRSFSLSLDPAQSEVGQAAHALLTAEAEQAKAEHKEELKQLRDERWYGVESTISGDTVTPPSIINEQTKVNAVVHPPDLQNPPELTGKFWTDVGKISGYNFAIAFLEGATKRLIAGIFQPQLPKPSRRGALGSLGSGSPGGGAKAPDVQTVSFSATGSEFDLLNEFTTCPEVGASIYNCVVDQNFATAIRDGMTIREAIKNDFERRIPGAALNVTLPFGYGGTTGEERLRHDSGYAAHNLKKLRRARIIPIGWEIAAEIVKAQRQPAPTLGAVLQGFNNPDSPFYRLVDPDWLLKAPLYYCNATAPGQLLASPGSEDRMEYCVDLQDCVAPTADGNGCQSWGYCTRERNTWQFDAKQCPAQFNTCLSYKRQDDGQLFAFNKNTTKACDANEVGCRWYALAKGAAANAPWNSTPRRYFNRTVSECAAQANGCTEFARLTDKTAKKPLTVAQYGASLTTAIGDKKNYEDYAANFDTKRLTIKYLGGTLNDCRGPDANPSANVGCERFTPTTGVDAPVPAVLQPNDKCPAACVGYDAYEEVKTLFSKGNFPEYFIPATARTCSADAVGCEEFTNLDAAGLEGEARENFTSLRQCQKPATDSRTYYTWVGTEKTGYQLETHSLKASNLDGGRAPCTTRDLQNGNVCNEAVQGAIDTRASCAKADLLTNPDCREFYDAQGNISYRLYSKTIVSSDACIRYRMSRSEGQENCNETGGQWDGANCIYLALPQESRSCSAEAVGCREYKGNTANDIRVVLKQDFEYKDSTGAIITPPNWSGNISAISLAQNGHSIGGERIAVTLPDVQENRTYILSLWAKGSLTALNVDPVLTNGVGKETHFAWSMPNGRLSLTTDWQKYILGPVFVTWKPDATAQLAINADGNTSFVIDTVVLQEVRDDFFLIKDSWTTPRECLYKDDGSLRQGDDRVVGCRAYTDRAGSSYAVKSFRQLCQEEFVGCEALVNTQNTTKPEEKNFPNASPDTRDDVTIPADTIAYVVNDPKNYCAPSEKGCSAMSTPQAVEGSAAFTASTVYLLNDPEKYGVDAQGKGSILCTAPNLSCEAYTKSAGGEDYFIDPYVKVTAAGTPATCEWKQLPDTLAQQFGWFKKGSSSKTPDCGTPTTDGSGTPADYVRECPAAADRCTQFIDPQDLSRSAVNLLFSESFEATDPPPGWNATAPTQLATVNGGIIEARALRANGGTPSVRFTLGTQDRHGPIQKGGAYRLSFWVKGNGGTLVTWFGGAPSDNRYFKETGGSTILPITENWTYHRLTRVATATESVAAQDIRFEGGGSITELFLDGVQLEAITDANDTGRPFYVIDDETLTKKRDRTLCSVVDQKAGCVLLQTENKGASQWDSTLSYQAGTPVACAAGETVCVGASDTNNGKVYGRGTDAAACAGSGGNGVACIGKDVNDLLKVQRDRVCGEWLSCISGTQVFDKQTQKTRDICYAVGSCTEPSVYNAAACGKMKDVDLNPRLLDVTLYKTRDLTWKGEEYVGHSIPYQYPVTNFVQLPYNINKDTQIPEGYRLHNLALKRDAATGAPVRCTTANKDTTCGKGPNKICRFLGKTVSALTQGYCYDDQGSGRAFTWNADTKSSADNAPRLREISKSCRAYPATDAPFPASDAVVAEWQGTKVTITDAAGTKEITTGDDEPEFLRPFRKQDAYRAANVSQQTTSNLNYTYNEAECSYYEVRYTDGETRFWGVRGPYPHEIVQGSGIKRDAIQLKYGWQGYCLETDAASPTPIENADGRKEACLTWFPALVQGEIDVNTNAPEAAFTVASDNRFYCVETREEEYRSEFGIDKKTKSLLTSDFASFAMPVLAAVSFGVIPGIIAGVAEVTDNSFLNELNVSGGSCLQCPSGYYPSACWKTSSHIRTSCRPFDAAIKQSGNGWYPYDYNLLPTESYRKICTKLALVSDAADQNLGWTERLKGPVAKNPRSLSPWEHPMNYPITQLSAPYGATDVAGITQEKETTFQICPRDPVTNVRSCDALVVEGVGAMEKPHAKSPYVKKSFNIYPYVTIADETERLKSIETHKNGVDRLGNVFARVFGVWEYVPKVSSCAARCSGGVYDAYSRTCNTDPSIASEQCPKPTTYDPSDPTNPIDDTGVCIPAIKKVCQGGTAAGAICTLDSTICTDTGGACVAVDPAKQLERRVCKLGTNPGQDCSFDAALCQGGGTCAETGTTFTSICDNGVNAGVECSGNEAICYGAGTCKEPPASCTIPEKSFVPLPKEAVWDFAGPGNTVARGPKVRAAEYDLGTQSYSEKKVCEGGGKSGTICTLNANVCGVEGKCVRDPNPGITVETKSSGDLPFRATAQGVSVKFYAYNENGEQMPLKRVIVDWDDESELSVTQGSLKNRKYQCQRFCKTTTVKNAENIDVPKQCSKNEDCGTGDLCEVANWGDDVNACIEDTPGGGSGYFTYTHIYRCQGPTSYGWNEGEGACVFTPRVQVLDNWGWCNGTCEKNTDGSDRGCYNNPNGTRQCETNNNAWTTYNGRVILKP